MGGRDAAVCYANRAATRLMAAGDVTGVKNNEKKTVDTSWEETRAALADCRAALRADAGFDRARLRAGTCLVRLGAFAAAEAEFNALLSGGGGNDNGNKSAEARELASETARARRTIRSLRLETLPVLRANATRGAAEGAASARRFESVTKSVTNDGGQTKDSQTDVRRLAERTAKVGSFPTNRPTNRRAHTHEYPPSHSNTQLQPNYNPINTQSLTKLAPVSRYVRLYLRFELFRRTAPWSPRRTRAHSCASGRSRRRSARRTRTDSGASATKPKPTPIQILAVKLIIHSSKEVGRWSRVGESRFERWRTSRAVTPRAASRRSRHRRRRSPSTGIDPVTSRTWSWRLSPLCDASRRRRIRPRREATNRSRRVDSTMPRSTTPRRSTRGSNQGPPGCHRRTMFTRSPPRPCTSRRCACATGRRRRKAAVRFSFVDSSPLPPIRRTTRIPFYLANSTRADTGCPHSCR